MSRSKRHTPILKVCNTRTEKLWKKDYNKAMRRHPIDSELTPIKNEYGDIWSSPSDGKYYCKNPQPKWMRK